MPARVCGDAVAGGEDARGDIVGMESLLPPSGDGNDDTRSHTPLREVGDHGNPIDELHPLPAAVFR